MKRATWTHWATTRDLSDFEVAVHDAGTGLEGEALGEVQFGGQFCFDPFDAYRAKLVSNPNMVIAGAIGAGKSTIAKMLIRRGLLNNRHVFVVDPKGEYLELAQQSGGAVIVLGVNGWCDPFPKDVAESKVLVQSLLATSQGCALSSGQLYELEKAWSQLDGIRPPRVLQSLFNSVAPALDKDDNPDRRSLALQLHRFVAGDLAKLFDGDGSPLTFSSRFTVLDLSAHWSSPSLPVLLLGAIALAQQSVAQPGTQGYLVLDEAWSLMASAHALAWLQGSWKLARARGLSHILILHRWSDSESVGDAGTKERSRAAGLLKECETVWLFRQPLDEANQITGALGLSQLERSYLTAVPKGTALVRFGIYRSIVRVVPNHLDEGVINTDQAMSADTTII